MDNEVELQVSVLNLTFTFRGFDAIREFTRYCSDNASNVDNGAYAPSLALPDQPMGPEQTQ